MLKLRYDATHGDNILRGDAGRRARRLPRPSGARRLTRQASARSLDLVPCNANRTTPPPRFKRQVVHVLTQL